MDPEFAAGKATFYSATEKDRIEALAAEIKESGRIDPLIAVDDGSPFPYVLEGGHRIEALRLLGIRKYPAMVVIDERAIAEKIAEGTLSPSAARIVEPRTPKIAAPSARANRAAARAPAVEFPPFTKSGFDGLSDQAEVAAMAGFNQRVGAGKVFLQKITTGKSLTTAQGRATQFYSNIGYREINDKLRGIAPVDPTLSILKDADKLIADLDAAIARSTVPNELVLYRGASVVDPGRFGNLKVGSVFTDEAYGSWSGNRHIAKEFADGAKERIGGKPYLFRIKTEPGQRALYVGPKEAEFILPRGARYRITAVDGNVVSLELDPEIAAAAKRSATTEALRQQLSPLARGKVLTPRAPRTRIK